MRFMNIMHIIIFILKRKIKAFQNATELYLWMVDLIVFDYMVKTDHNTEYGLIK